MTDDTDKLVREQPREMPSENGPLADYHGARPPAPAWFEAVTQTTYTTGKVQVDGADVAYQRWGDPSKPGLLFTHGNGAHAHWWDFVAPYFAATHNVAALSFSGMGDSGWRDEYHVETYSKEQIAVAEACGLFDHAVKPIIVAHSFGGFVTLPTVADHGHRFTGAVLIDSPVNPPERARRRFPRDARGNKVYPSLTAALARFRLAPPQPCENHFVMDYIARWSLKKVDHPEGGEGWTWKFDPTIWNRFDPGRNYSDMLKAAACRIAIFRGEDSALMPDDVGVYMRGLLGDQAPFISIPHAHHHVMLDQPLAFVAALRTLLGEWEHSSPNRVV